MTEPKIVNKKILMLLGGLSYFGSYITRVNLSAIIEELVSRNIFSKDTLAFAVTCNVIVYGIGLVISGVLTNRFQPKNLLFISLTVAALMNLMIPFCNLLFNDNIIVVVWGIIITSKMI